MDSKLAYEKPSLIKVILTDTMFLFLHVLGLIILMVKIKNCYTITTTPIYDITPDYKLDRRYKSGVRQIGESRKIVGSRDLTQEELDNLRKKGKYHINYLLCVLILFILIGINRTYFSHEKQSNIIADTTATIKKDSVLHTSNHIKKKSHKHKHVTKSYNYTESNSSNNHIGKRGGVYHYSKSGKKVYSKRH